MEETLPPPSPIPSPVQGSKWLFITSHKKSVFSITSLLIILTILTIALALNQSKKPAEHTTTQATPTSTPTPTVNQGENDFFASLPQTMLYYSFAQTSGNRNVYQSDITDTKRRNINIGFPGTYQFATSPDGRWLLRYNDRQLEKAPSNRPTSFTAIYTYPESDFRLTSLIFSSDSKFIALSLSKPSLITGKQFTSQLAILDVNNPKQIASILRTETSFRYQLVGYAHQQLWYVENQDGRLNNLTSIDLASKQTGQPFVIFNQNNQLSKIQFSADMEYAYTATDTYINQYQLATKIAKAIYTVNNPCQRQNQAIGNSISGISAAPSTAQLVVSVKAISCTNQAKPDLQSMQKIILINTQSGQTMYERANVPITGINQAAWSPNNQHLWITVDSSAHYEVELNQLDIHPIPSLDRQTLTKEKLYLLGWLSPFEQTP